MRLFLYGFVFVVCVVFGFIFFAGCTQTSSVSDNSSTSTAISSTSSVNSSSSTTLTGSNAAVSINNFSFIPNSLTIAVGTTVTWTNNDSVAHIAQSTLSPVSFGSGTLGTGSTFSFQFTVAGTYEYHCTIHPTMTGTIIVQ